MSDNQIEIIHNREVELLEKQRKVNLQKLFTPEGMDSIITTIKKEVADFEADVTTKEGRAKIVSMAAKIAKCKSPIEKLAKEAKDESQKIIAGIQTEWKRYEAEMDTLRDEIRKPVDEIEEREENERKQRNERIEKIKFARLTLHVGSGASNLYEKTIKEVRDLLQFDFGDFSFKAQTEAEQTILFLEERVAEAKKSEADAAELAQLKKEKEERDKKDREDQIAKDAQEKAKRDAEEEIKRANEEKRALEDKVFLQKRVNMMVTLGFLHDLSAQAYVFKGSNISIQPNQYLAKTSEYEWIDLLAQKQKEVEKFLEESRIATEKKAKEDAEKAVAEAIERERNRVEMEKRKEAEALEKREANKKHRNKINHEIHVCLKKILTSKFEVESQDSDQAIDDIIEAIEKGEVPHVQINY